MRLLICGCPLLQLPERLDAIVRVAEDAKTENADRDEQDNDSDEGDKKLAVDSGGHARYGTHQWVVGHAAGVRASQGSGRALTRSSW